MDHYIDIIIPSNQEFAIPVLLNAIYSKLHKRLCDLHTTNIGVSFPKYKITLGDKLRIHGSLESLSNLQYLPWLGSLNDYCQVSKIIPVPKDIQFRNICRSQANIKLSKLNRLLRRGSITEKDAQDYLVAITNISIKTPYVETTSSSNGHKYKRHIKLGELRSTPMTGEFDQFGLSKTATIPWFD
ncbi:MAG: type I-F CRISPR-associated endoribonuclease Cas6/Csy4 [Legionella sp.]|nr:MAG: type I-F CRISPR-associated endoribonuclease Cas6/Csy4 [Legionella sp.]PJD98433.1 MAG: type I-F CRISPR-associated endoribonuclease Cas6/Csy4 [Legionella sp.]